MSGQSPQSVSDAVVRAASTLLLAAIAVFVTWQLLEQFIVPLVIVVALVGIVRLALGMSRRDGW